jgi:hypothetical protein
MKARVRARRRRRKGIVGKQLGKGEVATEMRVQARCLHHLGWVNEGEWIKMQKGVAEGSGRRILRSQ